MKQAVRLVVLGVALSVATAAYGTGTVVSTHAVLGELAQVIGGEQIRVETIIPTGFCPAHYDLCPSDLAAILSASVVFFSGFEPWMETLTAATGSDVEVVQLPGSWSSPEAAAQQAEAIRNVLSQRFPNLENTFRANAAAYTERLYQLGDALEQRAQALRVSLISVVCMAWQEEFVSWLGFDVAATYGPPEALSLQDLVALAAAGRAVRAELVVDNLQSGVGFGAKLAREIGATHVVLSNFPGAMPGTATLLDLFSQNAASLFSAIEPLE